MSQWYIARGKVKEGPLSLARLQAEVSTGAILPTDMLLLEGTQKWVAAGTVADLFPVPTAVLASPGIAGLSRRHGLWIGAGIIGLSTVALLIFLLVPRQPSTRTPTLDASMPTDFAEFERLGHKDRAAFLTKNAPKRLEAWRAAAEKGSPEGQYLLARCFAVAAGVDKDPQQMVTWLRKSADQGFAPAQTHLGSCYLRGEGVARDKAEGIRWLTKSADAGYAGAQFNLGQCYLNGSGVETDPGAGVRWLRLAADQGNAAAQCELAALYWSGLGVARNTGEACRFSRLAAEQGLAGSQVQLGICYATGQGVAKDATEAVRWFRKAAEQEDSLAQTCLGLCYASGEGVAQDRKKAVELYESAAEAGNVNAMNHLARCYDTGEGVAKDSRRAAQWYRKGADLGDARAMYQLGQCYKSGNGVAKDPALSAQWLDKSEKAGFVPLGQQMVSAETPKDPLVPKGPTEAVRPTEKGEDPLPKGSRWRGTYDPPSGTGRSQAIEIVVTSRAGEKFTGEQLWNGRHHRNIEGTLIDRAIKWQAAIGERSQGHYNVGTLVGKRIDVKSFKDKESQIGQGGHTLDRVASGQSAPPPQATVEQQRQLLMLGLFLFAMGQGGSSGDEENPNDWRVQSRKFDERFRFERYQESVRKEINR